ncbi:MAG TPA: PQQ-binding-like beta-propeller repeat protein [Planctomycetota bacterium]
MIALTLALLVDDWTIWRGPAKTGISAETVAPWPEGGPKAAWKAEVGVGFSSFVVAGGRAYTIGWAEDQEHLYALDVETGKTLWKHSWPSDLGDKYFEGGPCSTPTIDGDRLYALGRWGELFHLDAATGAVVWKKDLRKETRAKVPDWGFSGSPRIHGHLLLINMGGAGLAVDHKNGNIVWKSSDDEAGYSTPLPFRTAAGELALVSSGKAWIAVDPLTGGEAWRIPWLTQYGVNAADPVVSGDLVFVTSAYGKGCGLFRMGAAAPVWESKVLSCQMSPPVLIDGHLYGFDGMSGKVSRLKCVELRTGKQVWAQDGLGCGTLSAAGGDLLVLSEKGELILTPATPSGFAPKARAEVVEGKCWTPPVLANGRLYVRTAAGDVVCLELRK